MNSFQKRCMIGCFALGIIIILQSIDFPKSNLTTGIGRSSYDNYNKALSRSKDSNSTANTDSEISMQSKDKATIKPGFGNLSPRDKISSTDQHEEKSSGKEGDCRPLHFSHDHPEPVTALASFPGSGNTGTRHLLQQATGIYTGAIYHSGVLKRTGFLGEGITNGSVLVIKTHIPDPGHRFYDQAILLMRNPLDFALANFNRLQSQSLTTVASKDRFERKAWTTFPGRQCRKWTNFTTQWLLFPRPMILVNYENLKNDTGSEVLHMLTFLNKTITEEQLNCVLDNSEGQNKRKQRVGYDVYTKDMFEQLYECVSLFLMELNSHQGPVIEQMIKYISQYLNRIDELKNAL